MSTKPPPVGAIERLRSILASPVGCGVAALREAADSALSEIDALLTAHAASEKALGEARARLADKEAEVRELRRCTCPIGVPSNIHIAACPWADHEAHRKMLASILDHMPDTAWDVLLGVARDWRRWSLEAHMMLINALSLGNVSPREALTLAREKLRGFGDATAAEQDRDRLRAALVDLTNAAQLVHVGAMGALLTCRIAQKKALEVLASISPAAPAPAAGAGDAPAPDHPEWSQPCVCDRGIVCLSGRCKNDGPTAERAGREEG